MKPLEIEIFFDSDGVLADFDARIEENHILKSLKDRWNGLLAKHGREDLRSLKKDELKKLFSGPQQDPTMAALKKAWNQYSNQIYVIANKEGFFLGLEEMPGARELLKLAHNLTGKLPHILTAPIKSNPNCEKEKAQWIEAHFSGLYDKFYCTGDKHTKAAPNAILIDDRPKYIKPFQDAGGSVVYYQNYQQASKDLRKVVNELIKSLEGKTFSTVLKENVQSMTEEEYDEYFEYIQRKISGQTLSELDNAVDLSNVRIEYNVVPASNKDILQYWLDGKIQSEGEPTRHRVFKYGQSGKIREPIIVDMRYDEKGTSIEGRHRLAAAIEKNLDVPVLYIYDPPENLLEVVVSEIVENVLDKMGKNKVSTSIRAGSVAGPVYTEFPSAREDDIVGQVSKNLHKKPYSKDPPKIGISGEKNWKKKS